MVYGGFEIVVRAFAQVDGCKHVITNDLDSIFDDYPASVRPSYKYVVLDSNGLAPLEGFKEYYDTIEDAVEDISEVIDPCVFNADDRVRITGTAGDLRIGGYRPEDLIDATGIVAAPVYKSSTSIMLSNFLGRNYVWVKVKDLSKVELISSKR